MHYWYLTWCVMAAAVAAAAAAPTHDTITMDLAEVADKAVCPMRVHIDEDPRRVPRLIKTLKCDSKPSAVCAAADTAHACCRHRHRHFSTQCVEVVDHVLVQYEGRPDPEPLPVPVGCTCMIREGTTAIDAS